MGAERRGTAHTRGRARDKSASSARQGALSDWSLPLVASADLECLRVCVSNLAAHVVDPDRPLARVVVSMVPRAAIGWPVLPLVRLCGVSVSVLVLVVRVRLGVGVVSSGLRGEGGVARARHQRLSRRPTERRPAATPSRSRRTRDNRRTPIEGGQLTHRSAECQLESSRLRLAIGRPQAQRPRRRVCRAGRASVVGGRSSCRRCRWWWWASSARAAAAAWKIHGREGANLKRTERGFL